jgi:DNA-binding HxlR family transcriptional regulator
MLKGMCPESLAQCSATVVKLVADYWVLRIIEELDGQTDGMRFSALERQLEGVSPVTLSNRLRRLEAEQLLTRCEGESGKTSVSYALSERGKKVLPVIRAVNEFSAAEV